MLYRVAEPLVLAVACSIVSRCSILVDEAEESNHSIRLVRNGFINRRTVPFVSARRFAVTVDEVTCSMILMSASRPWTPSNVRGTKFDQS